MPTYFGEMQMPGEPDVLPATVKIDKGIIHLQSGRTEFGEWKLSQVGINPNDDESVTFRADGEELILRLKEHDSFLAETAPYRRGEQRMRRVREHEAFRAEDEGPTLAQELAAGASEVRDEVGQELSLVAMEARSLWAMVKSNRIAWGVLAVVVIAGIFLTSVVAGALLIGGLLALVVGALGLAEDSVERRLPPALNSGRLLVGGGAALVLGLVIGIVF